MMMITTNSFRIIFKIKKLLTEDLLRDKNPPLKSLYMLEADLELSVLLLGGSKVQFIIY